MKRLVQAWKSSETQVQLFNDDDGYSFVIANEYLSYRECGNLSVPQTNDATAIAYMQEAICEYNAHRCYELGRLWEKYS